MMYDVFIISDYSTGFGGKYGVQTDRVDKVQYLNNYWRCINVLRLFKYLEVSGLMDDSSYRLNFDLGKKNKIHHHSQKERVKISKIAMFGCEVL